MQLSEAFSLLRQGEGCIEQIKKKEIDEEYQIIQNIIIPKTIHREILSERNLLLHIYELFVECYLYIHNNCNGFLRLYKIEQLLASNLCRNNGPSINFTSQGVKKIIESLKSSEQGFFYVLEFSGSKIIYKGSKEAIVDILSESNLLLSKITVKNVDNIKSFLSTNCSNICISATDNYFEEDIQFIRDIISFDEQHSAEECHNLYIDVSNLCPDNRSTINLEISKCYNSAIDVFNSLSSVVYIGLLFAMVESNLYKLHLPLEAYVISPIEETESYSFQSVPPLKLFNYSYFERIQSSCNFKNWIINFGACFSVFKKKGTNKKELLVESIRHDGVDIDSIEQIIYFENTLAQQLCVYVFDISRDVRISDGVVIYDDKNELSKALQSTYNEFHTNKNHKNESCVDFPCNSIFSFVDINSVNYKSLRGLLYSYVGMMLPKKVFILMRGLPFGGGNNYLLCVLKDRLIEEQGEQINLCHNLRHINTYLREVDNLTSKSIYENTQEWVVTDSSVSDINVDKKDPTMLMQAVIQLFEDEETKLKKLIEDCDETTVNYGIETYVYKIANFQRTIYQELIDYYLKIKTEYESQKKRPQDFINKVKNILAHINEKLQTIIDKINKLKGTKSLNEEFNKIKKEWETFINNIKWEIK